MTEREARDMTNDEIVEAHRQGGWYSPVAEEVIQRLQFMDAIIKDLKEDKGLVYVVCSQVDYEGEQFEGCFASLAEAIKYAEEHLKTMGDDVYIYEGQLGSGSDYKIVWKRRKKV